MKNQPDIETKSVTCPICKQKSPFVAFKTVNANADPGTDLPGRKQHSGDNTQFDERTTGAWNGGGAAVLGMLSVVGTGQAFVLRPGRNVIGRKAQASAANFQIATGEGKRMSREHLVIDVNQVGTEYMYIAKLYKEHVNDTFINDGKLCYGDCIVLKNGDIIHLPDADLKFNFRDIEGTTY